MDKHIEELSSKSRIDRIKSKFELAKSYGFDQLTVPMPDLEALLAQLEAVQKELCRAESRGVEKLAKAFQSWAGEGFGDYEAERHWAVASKEALSFAASLRSEQNAS
ncbi:hypothetical protein [Yersinia enterocolitica]|uniref:Uncharacterized protein n=2 Tax=Yersinia enterocolitica TaxID=630 RepID=A0A0T7P7T8_YEREN|nr:hypothetical protein [Yersinia enterocolitica]EKN3328631.1 hypothetical protein [Yersinia enterocolitica]EKN3496576.1 hypothetical protein [Yersinia enterocolitica]EKN3557452.1 hypothetical protein [Yersinia enterocolitica]EKN3692331.1 hypothetical protein [Yersinia enterocolitica]EKN4099216.1 hypothetical protein [Yersinia enterocolitica]